MNDVLLCAARRPQHGWLLWLAIVCCGTAGAAPPREFSAFFGRNMQMCQGCHGAPPSLPHSQSASRIVAVGAATQNGAELRRIMSAKHVSIAMEQVLADPDLTDEKLETIRRYLKKVRDGDVPAHVEFSDVAVGSNGMPQIVSIRNERAARDPAAVIRSIGTAGDYAIAPGGSCNVGGQFAGESNCTVAVQFKPKAKGARLGKLEFLLAPTPGLTPQKQTVILRGTALPR